jgi:opacity protein-like surface antigen
MARLPILTIALFSLLAFPVQAEEADGDYGRQGIYVAGYGLVGFARGDKCWNEAAPFPSTRCEGLGVDENGFPDTQIDGGANLRLGWRESPWLAYELEVEFLDLGGSHDGLLTWGPNAKFYLMDQAVQPFIVMGVNAMTIWPKDEKTNTLWAFRHGIGVDWYLTENIAISAEGTFVWATGNRWKSYYLTTGLGVLYRF